MLKGVSVARLTLPNPPAPMTSRSLFSPACAPSAAPTSCEDAEGQPPTELQQLPALIQGRRNFESCQFF
jgi:hypothetical protein